MWWLLILLAGVIVLIWVVDRRRGSTGASKAEDLPSGARRNPPDSGFTMQGGVGGDGGF